MSVTHRLQLLGHVALERLDQPAGRFPTRKAMALLGYLIRQSHPVARSELTNLLWPQLPDTRSRRNLTRELSQLAAQLPNCFQADYHTISWAPPAAIWVDTSAFFALLAPAAGASTHPHMPARRDPAADVDPTRLAESVLLYRSEFMADLYIDGCPEFETWLTREREFWRRQVMELLDLLIAHHTRQHTDTQAQAFARRCLELEPWHEEAHYALMVLLARNGKRNAALAQYQACRRVLANELDVEPAEATTALYEQIRTNRLQIADCRLQIASDNLQRPEGTRICNLQLQDWGEVPELDHFYGRRDELATLEHWLIAERCRVVVLLGIGGVGKTVLAAQLAHACMRDYEAVIWRSLRSAPPLEAIVRACLTALAAAPAPAERLDEQLARLLELIHQRRCLIILDNCESIFQAGARAGTYRPGYEDYGQLLRRIGASAHQSCLLLTSREQPQGLALLQSDTALVKSLQLAGLDSDAGLQLLRSHGLVGAAEQTASLIDRASGNPLLLQIVAAAIRKLFNGDLAAFLRAGTLIFDDIRDTLDQQWDRLIPLEQEILSQLALERTGATPAMMQATLIAGDGRSLLEALGSLQRRSLIEQQGARFSLQHIMQEYIADRLSDLVGQELELGKAER